MIQPWPVLRLAMPGESWTEVRLAQRGSRWRTKMEQGKVDVWGRGSGQGERCPERQTGGRVSVMQTNSETQRHLR